VLCRPLLGTEPGLDLVCLGCAELSVQGKCLLPVVAGSLALPGGVVAFGEVAVRACLLVGVASFVGQLERCLKLGAGGGRLAGGD
jgi:hypothetical protein